MFGIIIDDRFSNLRKFIFIILNIIQILIWIHLDFLSILLLKDIFWFSTILNISFIWHVLILSWLYKLCDYIGWSYMCFIISRLSLLTSLSWVLLLIKALHLLFTNIVVYFDTFYKVTKCNINYDIEFWKFISKKFIYILELTSLILNYFMKLFNNYSLFLLGKSIKFSFSIILKNYKYYIFLFLIFLISIVISVPRIYILWCSLFIWNWFNYILSYILYKNKDIWLNIRSIKGLLDFLNLFFEGFFVSRDSLYKEIEANHISEYWKLIYTVNYISSYIFMFKMPFFKRFNTYNVIWDAKGESWPQFTYFDIIRLFIYDKNWKAKLKAKLILMATGYSEYEDYEEAINWNCEFYCFSRWELCQAIRPDNIDCKLKFCLYPAEDKSICLCDYLFLCNGHYVVSLCISKKNQCIY
jgi:hypothetical protein